jgi:hypothetical protein
VINLFACSVKYSSILVVGRVGANLFCGWRLALTSLAAADLLLTVDRS